MRISRENNSIFIKLPFPVECEGNIFGKPTPVPKPDVTSLSSDQLKKFVKQCDDIKNFVTKSNELENDQLSTTINSQYYDIKKWLYVIHNKPCQEFSIDIGYHTVY